MIIGVTGGIGSGKTTVVKLFEEFKNVAVYIADIEAKKLTNSSSIIKKKIIKEFGEKAYSNTVINNKYIAHIVFNNTKKLAVLNDIIHPEVKKHFLDFVKKNRKKAYVIYESALLFETKSNFFCDKIICVTGSLQLRIDRVIKRDNITREEVLNRISNQLPQEKKVLQSHYCINNTDKEFAKKSVHEIHNILTKKTV